MIREYVKMNMDIISAFAEGKTIQYKTVTGVWCDLTESEGLPMGTLEEEPNNFRIKPEPKFRPFKNAEECWAEMQKNQPFGWLKSKENGYYSFITMLNNRFRLNGYDGWWFDETIKKFTFADGTTFGVKEDK